jgi:hypothetical protein
MRKASAAEVKPDLAQGDPVQETPFYKAKKEMAALNKRLEEQERALGVDHEETRAESRELAG